MMMLLSSGIRSNRMNILGTSSLHVVIVVVVVVGGGVMFLHESISTNRTTVLLIGR